MRTTFCLITIIMMLTLSAHSQFVNRKYLPMEQATMIVTYQLKYQQDSTNPSIMRNTPMLLFIGKSVSKFMSKAAFVTDTATRKLASKEQVIQYLTNPKTPHSGIQYEIYKNFAVNEITVTDYIPSTNYKYKEKLDSFMWTLASDSCTINGYHSQKAMCNFGGRSWVAWFCPDIPINDGPYKFSGLPGLILKVHDTRSQYSFEMLSVEKPEAPLLIDMLDTEYVLTTKQGFFKAQDSFRDDIISRAKEAGMDNRSQQTAARNMAARNNPIELDRK